MNIEIAISRLRKFFRANKRLPTYSEMNRLFGFASKKASFSLAQKLIKLGVLEKDSYGRLIPKSLFPPLPVLGTIMAGVPSDAEEQLLGSVSFDDFLVRHPDKSYLLKVSGDSMIDAGINPGDFVVIEKRNETKEGDIVAAQIDGEFTLKYFQKENGKACLVPANKKYSPFYPQNELSVFGVVVSVVRKYN